MQPVDLPRQRAPLVLGALGILTLAAIYLLPALVVKTAPWPVFAQPKSGCLAGQHTQRHAGGIVLGDGNYIPCLVDTGMTTGEPGLAITRDGTLLRSVTKSPPGIAVSADNGQSWSRRNLPAGARDGIPDGYIDPVTDRYFYSGLGNSPVYATDDKGKSWTVGSFDSPERYDWNKVFSGRSVTPRADGYPSNIYYCNMTTPGGFLTGSRCFKSIDGGRHFTTTGADPYRSGDCKDVTQPKGSEVGRGIVDPRDGAIYVPTHFCGAVELAVSHDEGATWTRRIVSRDRGSSAIGILRALASPAWRRQLMGGRANAVPAEMASNQMSDAIGMDASGRLYLVRLDNSMLPIITSSNDKGRSWSKPVRFNPPGVVQAVLPSLAVTADGRVGISYYGSTDRQTWTGYLTISENPAVADPTFETAAVTPADRPLMPEACCWASGPQEYTAARWAPDGSLWGAFAATVAKGDARGVMGRLVRQ